ncbi:hypothetical protein BC830DRAFT_1164765 [Chytriomyces sp. MP71]|nr:hypothetical protein BC830DRAFT_1164765 [Chytriomyces sp. MP71]
MEDFRDIGIYVQRPLHPGEDSQTNLMPPRIGGEPEASTDPERMYRRISADTFPLTLSLHAGGTIGVYGVIVVAPKKSVDYSRLAISVSMIGSSRTSWMDGIVKRGQNRVFADLDTHVLREADPFPWDNSAPFVHLPFAIYITTATESDGLPITFRSPSATVSYNLLARIRHESNFTGFVSLNVTAPVKVVPPWTSAAPPPTPRMGPLEDNMRPVADPITGNVQGSASVTGTNAESVLLRPRVLNNLSSALLDKRVNAFHSTLSVEQDALRRGSEASIRPGSVDLTRRSADATRAGDCHSVAAMSASLDMVAPPGGLDLSWTGRTWSGGASLSERGRVTQVDMRGVEDIRMRLQTQTLTDLGSFDLDNSGSDPVGDLEVDFARAEFRRQEGSIPSSPPMSYTETDPLPPTPLVIEESGPLVMSPFIEVNLAALAPGSSSNSTVHTQATTLEPPNSKLTPSRPNRSTTGLLRSLLKRVGSVMSQPTAPSSASINLQGQSEHHQHQENNGTTSVAGRRSSIDPHHTSLDLPPRSSSPAETLLDYLGAPEVPRFRIILPCTMTGAGSRIPIDIFIHSIPVGQTLVEIEAILVANVLCSAFGYTREDVLEITHVKTDCRVGAEARAGLVAGSAEGGLFKKRVWLTVPGADEMDVYGAQFKVPLIQLTHRMVFHIYTERRRRVGKGTKTESYPLGHFSPGCYSEQFLEFLRRIHIRIPVLDTCIQQWTGQLVCQILIWTP